MQGEPSGSQEIETQELPFVEDNTTDDQGRKKYVAEYDSEAFDEESLKLIEEHSEKIKRGEIGQKTTLYVPHRATIEEEKSEHVGVMFDEKGNPQMVVAGKGVDESGKISQRNRELEEQNQIDSLTGLKNRRGWDNAIKNIAGRISREEYKGYKLVITMADLNNLKYFNDNRGHDAGDEYLQNMATVLRNTFQRDDGDVTARIGGDEYAAVVLKQPNSVGYSEIEGILAGKLSQSGMQHEVNFSAAVVSIDIDEIVRKVSKDLPQKDREVVLQGRIQKEITDIIGEADSLMYEAKRDADRNRIGSSLKPTRVFHRNLSQKQITDISQ